MAARACRMLVVCTLAFAALIADGAWSSRSGQLRSGYHFVGHPVVVFSHLSGTYIYFVYFRLNHGIPEKNNHPLGIASIDGAGGSSGLSHVAPRSRLNLEAHCYEQEVENDFAYPRTLRHPRPGVKVRVLISVAKDTGAQRHFFFSLRLPLQRDKHASDPDYYIRSLGCLKR
jgi:hypothetical protein